MSGSESEFLKTVLMPVWRLEHMVMSPEFAGAMVTVIPVIILLGGAEVGAVLNRRRQNQERIDGLVHAAQERCLARIHAGRAPDTRDLQISRRECPYDSELSRITILYWIGSCVAAFLAEWLLIYWLAVEERPKSGALACFIALATVNGFLMVLLGIYSLVTDSRAFNKVLKAHSQPRVLDPALVPWLVLPPQPQFAPAPSSSEGA